MIPFSLLDLAPVPDGSSTGDALANTLDLAVHAEDLGFHRYWLAEHHNMPGIASAATSIMIGQVAARTARIRVGSGGVMLPNHAPLVIAEQFGTLATLFTDRIDLGLGRAPGTDPTTARALRRTLTSGDDFPGDVQELMGYFEAPGYGSPVQAVPGAGTKVPVWILGSSLYGAQLAADLGLPYAFASHFAPAALPQALELYRHTFRPSQQLAKPTFMLAVNVFAADSDEEARFLKSSARQAFANLRSGRPGLLPKPAEDLEERLPAHLLESVDYALSCSATGSPDSIARDLDGLLRTYQPDEVILAGQIHEHSARKRSFQIAAEVLKSLG
ncbi:LLM class flavin-dependent oxidoreductase [Rhodovibrionaceae bacterium A322]